MSIVVTCDCTMTYRLPDRYAGKRCRCRECGGKIKVPRPRSSREEERRRSLDPVAAEREQRAQEKERKAARRRARRRAVARSTTRRLRPQERDIISDRRALRTSQRPPVSESIHQLAPLPSGVRRAEGLGGPRRRRKGERPQERAAAAPQAPQLEPAAPPPPKPRKRARRRREEQRPAETAVRPSERKTEPEQPAAAPPRRRKGRGAKDKRQQSCTAELPHTAARRPRAATRRRNQAEEPLRPSRGLTPAVRHMLYAVVAIVGVLCLGIGLLVGGGLGSSGLAALAGSSALDGKLREIEQLAQARQWPQAQAKVASLQAELEQAGDTRGQSRLRALGRGIDKMAQILAVEDDEARLSYLLEYAADEDPAVRRGIAWELRAIAAEVEEAQVTLSSLAQDADPSVAEAARQALVEAGGPYALPYLGDALGRAEGERLEVAVHRALELDDPAVVPALVKLLQTRRTLPANLLRQVLAHLGELGDASALQAIQGYRDHADAEVKAAAEAAAAELSGS